VNNQICGVVSHEQVTNESPSLLHLLMVLAIKLILSLLQYHTLLTEKCPCSAAVLVTCLTGEGNWRDRLDACLTASSTAGFGRRLAFRAFVSTAKYEKALCRMYVDHRNNSEVVYEPFCQPVAVPAAVGDSAPFLQFC